MFSSQSFLSGDIVRPMPKTMSVHEGMLLLPDGTEIRHSEDFNAIIISHFLIAIKSIPEGEEVFLNINAAFYDLLDPSNSSITAEPGSALKGYRYLSCEEKQKLYHFADEMVRYQAIQEGFIPTSTECGVKVKHGQKYHDLISVADGNFNGGDVVFVSTGVVLPFPIRSTVELPEENHLRLTGGAEFLRHSCLPNLKLDIQGTKIVGIALRPIEDGEVLSFNYLCTEWEVSKAFHCACNVYCCYGVIKGFKYLDAEQQQHLLKQCSSAVLAKYRANLQMSKSCLSVSFTCSSALLSVSSRGFLVSQQYIPAGSVLCQIAHEPRVEAGFVLLDHVRVPHGCDANVIILGYRVVALRPLLSGAVLSCNTNLLTYEMSVGFPCDCGGSNCIKRVEGFKYLPTKTQNELWIYSSPGVRQAALNNGYQIPSCSDYVEVRSTKTVGNALFALSNIPSGRQIFNVDGLVLSFPTVYTIFLGEHKHLLFSGGAQCLAHSCCPNTRIVVDPSNGSMSCFALRDIQENEMISFNYLTTEWVMAEPFLCSCGNGEKCFGMIKGFRHLKKDQQLQLWSTATQSVRARYAQTQSGGALTFAHLIPHIMAIDESARELVLQQDFPSGTVLQNDVGDFDVLTNGKVKLGDIIIAHSCEPSAVLLEGFLVLSSAFLRGTPITMNINQLVYALEGPYFKCSCGSLNCCKEVKGFRYLSKEQQNELLLSTAPAVRAEAVKEGYVNQSCSPLVRIRDNGEMGQATFAAIPIPKGTRFFEVSGLVIPFPTIYTIMLEPGRHLLFGGGAQCLAHSCNPNVRIIVDPERRTIACQALRCIEEGELISFNYLTTEWKMNSPFQCICKSSKCFKYIKGFSSLSSEERQKLWSLAAPAIRSLAATQGNWRKLSGVCPLVTNEEGWICASAVLHQGATLLDASHVTVRKNTIVVDDVTLRHSCQPTASIVSRHVILLRAVCAGEEITLDINQLAYELKESFQCSCPIHASNEVPYSIKGFKALSDSQKSKEGVAFCLPAVISAAKADGFRPQSGTPLVEIKDHPGMGNVTFAAQPIRAGTEFLSAKGLRIEFPTPLTVMLDENTHLLMLDGVFQYLAHLCEPNVCISIDAINNRVKCQALHDIQPGELIGYNYNTTEWDMASPFTCCCGSPVCALTIRGHKYLTSAQRVSLQSLLSPAVRELAVMYSDVQLPSTIAKGEDGRLSSKLYIPKETVILEVFYLDVQPSQISLGANCIIPHSNTCNCVFVEGRIISCKSIEPGELLTVNLNYFVYDMTALFPHAYSESCRGFRYMDEAIKQKHLYLCEPPVRRQAMLDGWIVKSSQEALFIKPNGDMGQTAYASRDIPSSTILFHCTGLLVPFPTMYTICVGERQHLLFGDGAECIAHHCDPNVQVKVNGDGTFDFVTFKDIKAGDLVTFNYNTTEWHMNTSFSCLCGSEYCAGLICGFKSLSMKDRQRLWPITSPVVKAKCE